METTLRKIVSIIRHEENLLFLLNYVLINCLFQPNKNIKYSVKITVTYICITEFVLFQDLL